MIGDSKSSRRDRSSTRTPACPTRGHTGLPPHSRPRSDPRHRDATRNERPGHPSPRRKSESLGLEMLKPAIRSSHRRERGVDRGQRAAHRVLGVGLADLRMASDARGISHVFHAGLSIGVRRARDDPAIVPVPGCLPDEECDPRNPTGSMPRPGEGASACGAFRIASASWSRDPCEYPDHKHAYPGWFRRVASTIAVAGTWQGDSHLREAS